MDQGQIDDDSLEPSDDVEVNNAAAAARKVLKADREKLRRDKLNEQFLELGNLLDPDRPKNDNKASIVTDAIQVLKDLNSEVKKLKAENSILGEESRELTQEKNELREEKASLKSDIQDLKTQHQQTQRFMVPWATVDPILMTPSYSFPVALPVPPGSVPIHPTLQPLPFLANQHIATPSPCSTFIPYLGPVIPRTDQSTTSNGSTSYVSGPRTSSGSSKNRIDKSNDVATDLELKIPGSTAPKELLIREKGKQPERHQEKGVKNGSCVNKSSSQVFQGSSSDSVGDV